MESAALYGNIENHEIYHCSSLLLSSQFSTKSKHLIFCKSPYKNCEWKKPEWTDRYIDRWPETGEWNYNNTEIITTLAGANKQK